MGLCGLGLSRSESDLSGLQLSVGVLILHRLFAQYTELLIASVSSGVVKVSADHYAVTITAMQTFPKSKLIMPLCFRSVLVNPLCRFITLDLCLLLLNGYFTKLLRTRSRAWLQAQPGHLRRRALGLKRGGVLRRPQHAAGASCAASHATQSFFPRDFGAGP